MKSVKSRRVLLPEGECAATIMLQDEKIVEIRKEYSSGAVPSPNVSSY